MQFNKCRDFPVMPAVFICGQICYDISEQVSRPGMRACPAKACHPASFFLLSEPEMLWWTYHNKGGL